MIKVIVGLGNPGPQYANTRHNAGLWCLEQLVDAYSLTLRPENKFHGTYCKARIQGQELHFLFPTTFMNRSGLSVVALLRFLKFSPDSVLVLHDELDLPVGQAKLKLGGGHAGHNGLRDISAHIGNAFLRLRIGIGRPVTKQSVADYVLSCPSHKDKETIIDSYSPFASLLPDLVMGHIQEAIQKWHRP